MKISVLGKTHGFVLFVMLFFIHINGKTISVNITILKKKKRKKNPKQNIFLCSNIITKIIKSTLCLQFVGGIFLYFNTRK